MFGKSETEVLVVGAGPIGMFTALRLAENGVQVELIDTEWRTAAQSYAGVLHPRSLKLLHQAGLAEKILEAGRRIETIAFYEGQSRGAELRLSDLPVEFPFLLALPQSALEILLEQKLKAQSGVKVHWNHRLSDLQTAGERVVASIDKLEETAQGYSVPTFEWIVKKRLQTRAAFVIGADGHNSFVRQSLGLDLEYAGHPEMFAVYEFETDSQCACVENEVRIVLDESTTNVCWPLPGNRCRWSFQLVAGDVSSDADAKERTAVVFEQPGYDQVTQEHLHRFIQERAPWFKASVKAIDWSTAVQFERRMARSFGRDHCWLVGDAGHQTGPVGMQSMNVGLREADELAGVLTRILRQKAPVNLLDQYAQGRRSEWRQLLGLTGALSLRAATPALVRQRVGKILPCLPASGEELSHLLDQLGLDLAPNACACAA